MRRRLRRLRGGGMCGVCPRLTRRGACRVGKMSDLSILSRRSILGGIALCLFSALPSVAEVLPMPVGDVVLTVSGQIGTTTEGGVAKFDLDGLAALGSETISTSTIWTEGKVEFRGVPLTVFLSKLKAEGSVLRVWALNDYTVDVPFADAVEGGPMLAYEANGERLSVRDKGPIWLAYPFDSDPAYQTEVIYARSIWQIERMEVLD